MDPVDADAVKSPSVVRVVGEDSVGISRGRTGFIDAVSGIPRLNRRSKE
jgi:hypothetical protein